MKKLIYLGYFLLTINSFNNVIANASVPADQWLEIDLYWFDRDNMESSVNELWERYYPLFEGVEGWKGVILNVGWLMDYVIEWQGDMNQQIMLPKNMKKSGTFSEKGLLTGNSEERIAASKERFTMDRADVTITYQPWKYGDLKKLAGLLRKIAIQKYHIQDFKVGSLVIGWDKIYSGELSNFTKIHSNVFLDGIFAEGVVNLEAILEADPGKFRSYADGIPEGTPFTVFFGKQWGSFSKEIGLDAILFRDSFLGSGVYGRKGPYGTTAPEDPAKVESWTRAAADLIKQTKTANPKCIIMGYSNGASGVADWRVNCLDLESIAKEGYLDAWIDQTWAGAWNETGQRPGRFWNFPDLGWTYQLSYLLARAATLAETKVHHYFLTETFDAWESWDIIHNAPDRLRWGIWAYSHAAVKTPSGLKVPSGSYISWCNEGKNLLSAEDVRFLTENSNEAFLDADRMQNIFGPTMVYCRSAMEWQSKNAPAMNIKEWIDEQAGTLMKWGIPIMSVTRSEYLPEVESDLFILQTPSHLTQNEKDAIINLMNSGKPVAVFGSPVGGIDPEIADILGISSKSKDVKQIRYIGYLNYRTRGIFEELQNTFPIYQPFSMNIFGKETEVIYSVDGSPCLGFNSSGNKQILFWDPPELKVNVHDGYSKNGTSTDELIGSPVPWVLTARVLNLMLKNSGMVYTEKINLNSPVYFSAWQKADGSYQVLAGDLEEGINHTGYQPQEIFFVFPDKWSQNKICSIAELWEKSRQVTGDHKISVMLDQGESRLFSIK